MEDVQAYIESGIIERFVLGETNPRETEEVMALAKLHPEIQAEISAVESTLIQLAEAGSYRAAEETKEKLFKQLFDKEKQEELPEISPAKPVRNISLYRNLSIAAAIALLLSIGSNLYLYQKLDQTEAELIAINAEKIEFAENLKTRNAGYTELEQQLQAVLSPDIIPVTLNGLNSQPQAKALVYYNANKKDVYLHLESLSALEKDQQYQLWAIVDGKPVDVGVFDAENKALLKMKNSDKPSAFAVTIEKRGGNPTPTLEAMVLLGNVAG